MGLEAIRRPRPSLVRKIEVSKVGNRRAWVAVFGGCWGAFLVPLDSKKLDCKKTVAGVANVFLSADVLDHGPAAGTLIHLIRRALESPSSARVWQPLGGPGRTWFEKLRVFKVCNRRAWPAAPSPES
jgi:hypothetical protein